MFSLFFFFCVCALYVQLEQKMNVYMCYIFSKLDRSGLFLLAKCISFHYNGKVVKFMCIIRLVVYISSSLAMLLMCHIYMNKKLFCSSQMTRCCSNCILYTFCFILCAVFIS